MGKINKQLFDQVFGDGTLEVEVQQRHMMDNKPIVHKNKKKYQRSQNKQQLREVKETSSYEDFPFCGVMAVAK